MLTLVVAASAALILIVPVLRADAADRTRGVELPPKTLLGVSGSVVTFAQSGDYVGWTDASAPCGRMIVLKSLSTGASTFLDSRDGPVCAQVTEDAAFVDSFALAGRRALWTTADTTFSSVYFTLFTAAVGSRREQVLGQFAVDLDDPALAPVPVAGAGKSLAFSLRAVGRESDDFARSGVYRIAGTRLRHMPDTEHAIDVDTDGTRLAFARVLPPGDDFKEPPLWSPDGSRIAFAWHGEEGGKSQLLVMGPDGRDLRPLLEGESGPYFAWSPDGTAIATYRARSIVVASSDDAAVRRVHPGGRPTGAVVWSPDGRRLAFGEGNRVYVATVPGGGPNVVGVGSDPTWAPDSQRLAYVRRVGPNETHVFANSAAGGAEIDLGAGTFPKWSHDSEHVAYSRFEPPGVPGGRDQIYVVRAEGGARKHLGAGSGFEWSPARTEIAFTLTDGFYVADASNGFVAERVAACCVGSFSWSPDGSWLAFERQGELWAVSAATRETRNLGGQRAAQPRWSVTSRSIAYRELATGGAPDTMVVVDVDGGVTRRVGPSAPGDWGGLPADWSPDGRSLAYVSPDFEISVADVKAGTTQAVTRTSPARERRIVELRSPDGKLLSRFDASLRLSGLAFSGARMALVIDQTSRVRPEPRRGEEATIEVRTFTGRLLRKVRVPRPIWGEVDMSGRWVVFTTWSGRSQRVVRLLDVVTGRTSALARSPSVVGLSIDGRRVAWAERGRGKSLIRAVMLKGM